MQEELNKLRAESKQLKSRLKQESDSRKNWQDISKKKDDDLNAIKQQLMIITKEVDQEKAAHAKTQTGLHLKTERLRIADQQNKQLLKKLESFEKSPIKKKPQHSYE